jgi:hypothetical protein
MSRCSATGPPGWTSLRAGVEVTIRVPSDATAGQRQQETRSFATTRAELESLGDWPAC